MPTPRPKSSRLHQFNKFVEAAEMSLPSNDAPEPVAPAKVAISWPAGALSGAVWQGALVKLLRAETLLPILLCEVAHHIEKSAAVWYGGHTGSWAGR